METIISWITTVPKGTMLFSAYYTPNDLLLTSQVLTFNLIQLYHKKSDQAAIRNLVNYF